MSPSDWQCAGRRWAIPCKICVYWIANASVSRLRLRLLCVRRFATRCWRSATLCLKIFCLAPLRKQSECFENFLCVKKILNATKKKFYFFAYVILNFMQKSCWPEVIAPRENLREKILKNFSHVVLIML